MDTPKRLGEAVARTWAHVYNTSCAASSERLLVLHTSSVCIQELQAPFWFCDERNVEDGTEAGAWLSLTIAAHELIYVADAYSASGRLHHLAFWVDTRKARAEGSAS